MTPEELAIYQMQYQQAGNTANGQALAQNYVTEGIAAQTPQGVDTTGWTPEQIANLQAMQNPNGSLNTQGMLDTIKYASGADPAGPGQYNMLTDAGALNAGGGLVNQQIGNANNVSNWAATTDYDTLMASGSLDAARTHTMNMYATGQISAEEAQELENQAFEQQYGSLEHVYKSVENEKSSILDGTSYVETTITPTDYSAITPEQAFLQAESHNDIENEFVATPGYGEMLFKMAATGALTAGAGAALAPAIGGFTGVAQGAIKGALNSGIGGLVQGNGLDIGDIAKGALTGGVMAGATDYIRDSIDGLGSSDVGGLFGESGLLGDTTISTGGLENVIDKGKDFLGGNLGLAVGTEVILNPDGSVLGTRAELGDSLFEAAMNGAEGGLTTGVIQPSQWSEVLSNLSNSEGGQWLLDNATKGLLNGYNEDWRDNAETGVMRDSQGNLIYEDGSSLPATYTDYDYANMSEQDLFNKRYFEAAVEAGIWRLDEQYSYTDTERDPDSTLLGVLTRPIEEGGTAQPPTVANPNGSETETSGEGGGDSENNGDGEDGEDGGDETGNESGAESGTELGTSPGGSTSLGGVSGSGYTKAGEWVGNEQVNELMAENGMSPPQSDDIINRQLLEAIFAEQDPGLQQDLISEYKAMSGENVTDEQIAANSTDGATTVPSNNRFEQILGLLGSTSETEIPSNTENQIPNNTETQLPPNQENQLPPNGGGGGPLPGLLAISGDDGSDNPYWTPLNPYSKVSKWKKARERVYNNIEGLLTPTGRSPEYAMSKRQMTEEGLLS